MEKSKKSFSCACLCPLKCPFTGLYNAMGPHWHPPPEMKVTEDRFNTIYCTIST